MCTAATYKTKNFYFGRTLDYEFSYGEEVTITPRNFPLLFRHTQKAENHYAIIGMAHVMDNYPLYYDAINEKGLCVAGLNFVGNAFYNSLKEEKINVAQFEFIPFILSQCSDVSEAKELLKKINVTNTLFHEKLPAAQLHWIIADSSQAITVEAVKEGLMVYDNPIGVLTNNPPFPEQMRRLSDFLHLSPKPPVNNFAKDLSMPYYSRGMGALGLPGDLSSASRFARVAFVKANSISQDDELSSVSQFFHILNSVDQQRGCCELEENKYEITIYTSCCNASKGIYYYTTYDNHRICGVDMNRENLNGTSLIRYPLIQKENIFMQN